MQEKTPCPHCKTKKFFWTIAEHPRGAGHRVPCSKCEGKGYIPVKRGGD